LLLTGNTLSFDIAYTNLSSPVTVARLCGPAGANQPAAELVDMGPLKPGTSDTNGRLLGSVVLTREQTAVVLSGLTYVSLGTTTYPAGEIRGQNAPDSAALQACAQPAFDGLQISFRLDPWLIGGSYGGGFWVSATSLGPVTQGATFTIETRAGGLYQGNASAAFATWMSSNPQMVTVFPEQGSRVTLRVLSAGLTAVDVIAQGTLRRLSISATNNSAGTLLVQVSQGERLGAR
jgi:hypothetical protein